MDIKYSVLGFAVKVMKVLYALLKLQKIRNKIVIISRQSSSPSIDIRLIETYFKEKYSDIECVVLCRYLDNLNPISYLGEVMKQMKHMAQSKVILLDGYCIAASILKHKPDTKVVQMWHALAAIKKFGYETIGKPSGHSKEVAEVMCMHRNYDYVISPSKATGEIFCRCFDVSSDRVEYMALPRVDEIVRPHSILPEEFRETGCDEFRLHVRDEYGIGSESEIILYVPTFRKNKKVELKGISEAVENTEFTLIVKAHPVFKGIEISNAETLPNVIVDWKYTSYQWLSICDRVVTDYSALGVEAALTGKPLYFFAYDIEEYSENVGLNFNPIEELPTLSASKGTELKKLLEGEYDYEALSKFRNKYVSADIENCTSRLGDFLAGIFDDGHNEN